MFGPLPPPPTVAVTNGLSWVWGLGGNMGYCPCCDGDGLFAPVCGLMGLLAVCLVKYSLIFLLSFRGIVSRAPLLPLMADMLPPKHRPVSPLPKLQLIFVAPKLTVDIAAEPLPPPPPPPPESSAGGAFRFRLRSVGVRGNFSGPLTDIRFVWVPAPPVPLFAPCTGPPAITKPTNSFASFSLCDDPVLIFES